MDGVSGRGTYFLGPLVCGIYCLCSGRSIFVFGVVGLLGCASRSAFFDTFISYMAFYSTFEASGLPSFNYNFDRLAFVHIESIRTIFQFFWGNLDDDFQPLTRDVLLWDPGYLQYCALVVMTAEKYRHQPGNLCLQWYAVYLYLRSLSVHVRRKNHRLLRL